MVADKEVFEGRGGRDRSSARRVEGRVQGRSWSLKQEKFRYTRVTTRSAAVTNTGSGSLTAAVSERLPALIPDNRLGEGHTGKLYNDGKN